MKLLLFIFAFSASSLYGQQHLVVHRHWVGQGAADFLAAEPVIAGHLKTCGEMSVDMTAWVASHYSTDADARRVVEEAVLADPGFFKRKTSPRIDDSSARMLLSMHGCPALLSAFGQSGDGMIVGGPGGGGDDGDPLVRWHFRDGLLVEIYLNIEGEGYAAVVSDVTTRMAVHPDESVTPMQNAYGAAWNDRAAHWLTPDLHCFLEERNNPSSHLLQLRIQRRIDFDADIKRAKGRPSALD